MGLTNFLWSAAIVLTAPNVITAQERPNNKVTLKNQQMEAVSSLSGITAIRITHDPYGAEVVGGSAWERVNLTYYIWIGSWMDIHRVSSTNYTHLTDAAVRITDYEKGMPRQLEQTY